MRGTTTRHGGTAAMVTEQQLRAWDFEWSFLNAARRQPG